MASLPRRLLLQSRQCPRFQCVSPAKASAQWHRPLSTTTRLAKEDSPSNGPAPEEDAAAQLRQLVKELRSIDPEFVDDAVRDGRRGRPIQTSFDINKHEYKEMPEPDRRKLQQGFWAHGEPSMGVDEDFYGDDVTSMGHGELQKHRELREYARLIAWEMPLLNQLAKPFEVPTEQQIFRFRYTSYVHESHPAANKVVVEFAAPDLKLTPVQTSKLIKLAGPRYNPNTQIIKMSCEKFDTQAQNKRFLGETISALVKEAKDPKDTFEDVPFDFRHRKVKKRWEFPKEWVLTEERKAFLEARRRETAELEDGREGRGEVVNGKNVIEARLPFLQEREPVMVTAGKR